MYVTLRMSLIDWVWSTTVFFSTTCVHPINVWTMFFNYTFIWCIFLVRGVGFGQPRRWFSVAFCIYKLDIDIDMYLFLSRTSIARPRRVVFRKPVPWSGNPLTDLPIFTISGQQVEKCIETKLWFLVARKDDYRLQRRLGGVCPCFRIFIHPICGLYWVPPLARPLPGVRRQQNAAQILFSGWGI